MADLVIVPGQFITIDGQNYFVGQEVGGNAAVSFQGLNMAESSTTPGEFWFTKVNPLTRRLLVEDDGKSMYAGMHESAGYQQLYKQIPDATGGVDLTPAASGPGAHPRIHYMYLAMQETDADVVISVYDSVGGNTEAGRIARFPILTAAMSGAYPIVPYGGHHIASNPDCKLVVHCNQPKAFDIWYGVDNYIRPVE